MKENLKLKNRLVRYGFMASILIYPLVLWVIFFTVINGKSILYSVQNIDIYGNAKFAGFQHYKEFITQLFTGDDSSLVVYSLFNSVRWWFINLLISTPINLAFSYYVFLNFRGSKFFRICAMIPVIVSGLIFTLLFQKTMNWSIVPMLNEWGFETASNNLFNDPDWALPVNIIYGLWSGLTTVLIIIPNAMKDVGEEVLEAADMDGVNIYTKFWYIVLPLIMPIQVTTWVTGIAGLFSTSYNLVTFYQYNAPDKLYTLGYYYTVKVMTSSNRVDYPMMAASGMCLTVLATTVTLVAKRCLLKLQERFE